jgi:hypothetical protein
MTRIPFCRIGFRRGRTVGAFEDDLGLDARCILGGEHALERRRQQHVAFLLQGRLAVGDVGGPGEVQDRTFVAAIVEHLVFVEALRVRDGAFALGDHGDDAAAFATELGGVVADVAEALDDDAFAVEPA